MNQQTATLKIDAEVSGDGDIKRLDSAIGELGNSGQDAARKGQILVDQLAQLNRQQQLVEQFRELKTELVANSAALAEIQGRTRDAAGELRTAQTAVQGFATRVVESREAVEQQRASLQQARDRLKEVSAESRAAKGANEELAKAVLGAKEKVEQERQALVEARAALKEVSVESRAANKEAAARQSAFDQSVRSAREAASAEDRLTRSVHEARSELRDSGVDVTKLASEQVRLSSAAGETRESIGRLTQSFVQQKAAMNEDAAAASNLGRGIADAARAAVDAQREQAAQVKALDDAYARLGLTSPRALRAAADEAKRSYEAIRAGGASVSALDAAYVRVARTALEAARAEGTVALEARAAALQGEAASARQAASLNKLRHEYGLVASAATIMGDKARSAGDVAGRSAASINSGYTAAAQGVRSISNQLDRLQTVAAGFIGFQQLITQGERLADLSDEIKGVESRLRLATESQAEFNAVQEDLIRIADETRTAYAGNVDLYSRLKKSTAELAIENDRLLAVTKAISEAQQIGGGTAESQRAALIQLGQGLAAGALRGEEFNSVMEQSPRLAQALADGLDVPIGQLRKLAEEGELTTERVFGALEGQADAIAEEFGRLEPTIGGALTQLRNNFALFVSDIDKSNGISAKAISYLQLVGKNLDSIASLMRIAGEVAVANLAVKGASAALEFATSIDKSAVKVKGLGDLLSKLPTALNVAIAVIGFELLQEAGEKIGEYAAKWAGADDAAMAAAESRKQQLIDELFLLEENKRVLGEYAGVQTLTAAETARLDETTRAAYAAQLQGLELLLLKTGSILLREQELAVLRGESTAEWDAQLASNAAKLAQVRTAQEGLTAAQKTSADALKNGVTPEAQKLVEKFDALSAKGKTVEESLKAISKGLDPRSIESVQAYVQALGQLESQGKLTSLVFEESLRAQLKAMSAEDLVAFDLAAKAAFGESEESAALLGKTLEFLRNEQFARLGVDAVAVLTGIDEQAQGLLTTFSNLAEQADLDAKLIRTAYESLLERLDSPEELESLKASLASVKIEGFNTADAIEEIDGRIKALRRTAEEEAAGIAQAFRTLGIISQAEFDAKADAAERAYQRIRRSGVATAEDLARAFEAYAEAQLQAVDDAEAAEQSNIASKLRAIAATEEQRAVLEQLIAKYLEYGQTADAVNSNTKRGIDSTTDSLLDQANAASNGGTQSSSGGGGGIPQATYNGRTAAAFGDQLVEYQMLLAQIQKQLDRATDLQDELDRLDLDTEAGLARAQQIASALGQIRSYLENSDSIFNRDRDNTLDDIQDAFDEVNAARREATGKATSPGKATNDSPSSTAGAVSKTVRVELVIGSSTFPMYSDQNTADSFFDALEKAKRSSS